MKVKRLFFLVLGCVCLGLGCIGVVLPILPTVPFFLVTVFCFAKSSQRLHSWFVGTRLYQKASGLLCEEKGHDSTDKGWHHGACDPADGSWYLYDATRWNYDSQYYFGHCMGVPCYLLCLWSENDCDKFR